MLVLSHVVHPSLYAVTVSFSSDNVRSWRRQNNNSEKKNKSLSNWLKRLARYVLDKRRRKRTPGIEHQTHHTVIHWNQAFPPRHSSESIEQQPASHRNSSLKLLGVCFGAQKALRYCCEILVSVTSWEKYPPYCKLWIPLSLSTPSSPASVSYTHLTLPTKA